MATYYVETSANGGGDASSDGSEAHPWLWDEMVAAFNSSAVTGGGSLILIGPATQADPHLQSARVLLNSASSYTTLIARDFTPTSPKPVIKATAAMDYMIQTVVHGNKVVGLHLDANSLAEWNWRGQSISTIWMCVLENPTQYCVVGAYSTATVYRCLLRNAGVAAVEQNDSVKVIESLLTGSPLGVKYSNHYDMLQNCVVAANDTGMTGTYPQSTNGGNIYAGNTTHDIGAYSSAGRVTKTIALEKSVDFGGYLLADGVFTMAGELTAFNTYGRAVGLASDPFTDPANLDFGLTTYGKEVYRDHDDFAAIYEGVRGVPGITMTPRADLMSTATPTVSGGWQ